MKMLQAAVPANALELDGTQEITIYSNIWKWGVHTLDNIFCYLELSWKQLKVV